MKVCIFFCKGPSKLRGVGVQTGPCPEAVLFHWLHNLVVLASVYGLLRSDMIIPLIREYCDLYFY